MLSNLHTHSVFCDGKNTPEEIVLAAIEQGLSSIGFSGHGFTSFDSGYCMKDTAGYICEIKRLKEKYQDKIEVCLGVEEDAFYPVNRADFDYIIGSCHYYFVDGKYYPVDTDPICFQQCLTLFDHDPIKMAHTYYQPFCEYVLKRKPDIVGHFDLITKFDQLDVSVFLDNAAYHKVAEAYIRSAASAGCLFEVNTGAIARGYRTSPYPHENLVRVLYECGSGVILSSDSHNTANLTFGFDEAKKWLKDIGFTHTFVFAGGRFIKDPIE